MRSMISMETVQIEITNACGNRCSNCTRFVGYQKPYFMEFDLFKEAVDSMVGYPRMTGVMGGEPLLHPEFKKFCKYISSKIPYKQLGLWTCFPKGFEHHREIICETFCNIFLNDHTRNDIFHHPPLVAIEEVINDRNQMWQLIDKCWAQMSWSASINPRGAWFCEMAASFSMLFEEGKGWKVEPGWWWRIPKDFKEQMEQFCPRCGMAAPIKRIVSTEIIDDLSLGNYERLKNKSYKIKRGLYRIHDLSSFNSMSEVERLYPRAAYKDFDYRNAIADRYGVFLVINDQNYWTPYLKKEFGQLKYKPLLEIYQERWV